MYNWIHISALLVFMAIHGLIGLFRYLSNYISLFIRSLFWKVFVYIWALRKALVDGGQGFIKEDKTESFCSEAMKNWDWVTFGFSMIKAGCICLFVLVLRKLPTALGGWDALKKMLPIYIFVISTYIYHHTVYQSIGNFS